MVNATKIITDVQWKKLPTDYKSVIKGQKYMLDMLPNGATGLVSVEVVKLKDVEAKVEAAFYEVGFGVQINIMNLSKITKAGVDAYLAGADVKEAVANAVKQYAEN